MTDQRFLCEIGEEPIPPATPIHSWWPCRGCYLRLVIEARRDPTHIVRTSAGGISAAEAPHKYALIFPEVAEKKNDG